MWIHPDTFLAIHQHLTSIIYHLTMVVLPRPQLRRGATRQCLVGLNSRGHGWEQLGGGAGGNVSRNANYASRKCKDFSLITPFYNRERAELETRRGPSAFENMPFLPQEGRLQRTRKACSRMVNVIRWFHEGYANRSRRCLSPNVRVFSLIDCNVFSYLYQYLTPITQHPSLAVTFCEFCMPEAFCEFETLVEKFCSICEFCERKTSPRQFSNVLFLTEYTEE